MYKSHLIKSSFVNVDQKLYFISSLLACLVSFFIRGCPDRDVNCEYWASLTAENYCTTNDYVKDNCKYTCNLPCKYKKHYIIFNYMRQILKRFLMVYFATKLCETNPEEVSISIAAKKFCKKISPTSKIIKKFPTVSLLT